MTKVQPRPPPQPVSLPTRKLTEGAGPRHRDLLPSAGSWWQPCIRGKKSFVVQDTAWDSIMLIAVSSFHKARCGLSCPLCLKIPYLFTSVGLLISDVVGDCTFSSRIVRRCC